MNSFSFQVPTAFTIVAVSGQSDIDSASTPTLTFAAGTNITLTTNAGTGTVTINATGGGLTDGDYGDITVSGSGTVLTVDNQAITLAKIVDIATASFLGRNTAGTGVTEVLSAATVKTMLNLTGTNSGDQTITLTGDVTGSGTGSFAATIANNAVTLAKLANIDSGDFIARNNPGNGDPEAITSAEAKVLLNLSGTNSGDQTITLTSDVTGSGTGSFAATIANDAVTYAKMQNVSATDRVLGRVTAGAGDVEEITCTAAGRALLDDIDAAAQRTTLGLGTLATQSGTFSGTSSGTNTGDQNLFSTVAVSGQSNVVADAASDTLTLVAGTNVTITTDAGTDAITINASGGGGNSFQTIAVAGQSDVVADSSTDTLTLVAGTNITLTTNAGTDTITIAATGGGSGLTQPQVMAIGSLRI